jgi:ATP-dependent DNA helicase RecG
MRPEILNPLFAPTTVLPGVGPRLAKLVEKLVGERVVDLLWHLPNGLIDRSLMPKITEAPNDAVVTLTVRVDAHRPPPARNKRLPYKVRCSDDSGAIELVFFHARPAWLEASLPIGEMRVVSGRIERYGDASQMIHPDHIVPLAERASLPALEPVYALTEGLTPKVLRRAIQGALATAPTLPEWLDPALQAREGWPAWREAVLAVHDLREPADLEPTRPARRRLAYDELLANQLALALVRARLRHVKGRALVGDGRVRAHVTKHLPFQLTDGQRDALAEIEADLASERRMVRLLQGDVGSGKTVIALMAMLIAVEAGGQAAIMAPTEILARQHYVTLVKLAGDCGVRIVRVLGRDKAAEREAARAALSSGQAGIAVGTHALLEEDVAFRSLRLVIIDEQHRFGVHQRMILAGKGSEVDILVMTATPIPRTLMLTAYGDMDVTRLNERPPGRAPIETRVLPVERLEEVLAAARRAITKGNRIYWVCPLVEESEAVDLAAAVDRHAQLKTLFGARVGLVHGRMKGKEKDVVMADFAAGAIDLLVATTVIEVGIDVPEASVIVIEHAERFGLAQLHQLRGRVGRGGRAGVCLLLYGTPLSKTARARLKILRETDDGFRIAEEDLRLRGAGELLGTRQSGLPAFRLADLAVHDDLLMVARDDARLVLEKDSSLGTARGQALRVLLYLFERDAAIRLLNAG